MIAKDGTSSPSAAAEVHRLPRVCYLKGLSGETAGKVFYLAGKTIIGRRSDCAIVIPSKGVSRQHASIEMQGNEYVIQDLESANGTFVNGKRITSVPLAPGDQIAFDNIHFIFKAVHSTGAGEETRALGPERSKATPALSTNSITLEKSLAQRALTAGVSIVMAVLLFLLIWSMFI